MSSNLETWRIENREEIEKVWNKISCMGLATVCSKCRGGSISNCECAHQRFLNRITPEDLKTYKSY